MKITIPHLVVDNLPVPPSLSTPASSVDCLFSPALPAPTINDRQEVGQTAQAGKHGGRQVDLVQAEMRVLIQVAVRVAIRLVDHDPDGRQVKRGGGHVVRQVGAQPTLPSQQRDQVLLAQEGQEKEGEGQEPKQDSHKQDEVNRSLVFVGGDGDPEPGTESDLQDPGDPQKTPEELHHIPPHLRLGRLGWHLSPPPVTVGPFFPDRAGASCQLQTAGKDRCNKTKKSGKSEVKGFAC